MIFEKRGKTILHGVAQLWYIQHDAVYTPDLECYTASCCISPYIFHNSIIQVPTERGKNLCLFGLAGQNEDVPPDHQRDNSRRDLM